MEYIEITGKTVDEAITNATIKLSVTSNKLDYVVVDKGNNGFLGIGKRPAVIKVRVAENVDEFEQAVKGKVAETKTEEKPAVKKTEPKKEEKPVVKKAEPKKEEKPVVKKAEPKHEEVRAAAPAPKQEVKPEAEYEEVEKSTRKPVAGPDMESAIKKFLSDVLGAMGMNAEVKVVIDENEGSVDVELVGENMGVLIGKRGQTLDSLQYLVSLVANKEAEGYFRVKLDTENYRARRKETLESLAKNIAYKVKRTRKPVSLEPMNPYERRIIHSALQNDRYVSTRSEGEEPFRHVVVYLKKNV
mgnify:CR=1 FL=1